MVRLLMSGRAVVFLASYFTRGQCFRYSFFNAFQLQNLNFSS